MEPFYDRAVKKQALRLTGGVIGEMRMDKQTANPKTKTLN